MRTLYHFATSPFARRVRLGLAHKSLAVELKDGRQNPAYMTELRETWPTRTVPVLVEEDGGIVGGASAILHYLDGAYPDSPPIWPRKKDALRKALAITELVDSALDTLVDAGTRYSPLQAHPAWKDIEKELMGRVRGTLDALAGFAAQAGTGALTDAGWCGADMGLITLVGWAETLPLRAPTTPHIRPLLALDWKVPPDLERWADAHRSRADVVALGGPQVTK